MRALYRRLLATVGAGAFIALAACGDIYADPAGDIQPTPRPSFEGGVFPRDVPTSCPARRPTENSPCTHPGSSCEYGSSPDIACNSTLGCIGDSRTGQAYWDRRTNGECQADQCPGTDAGSIDGKPCNVPFTDAGPPGAADELLCQTLDGLCACTTGRDGAHVHERRWVCIKPILQCPTDRPLAGHPCPGSLWCDYGSCKFKHGVLMQCRDGIWLTGGMTCE